MLECGRALVIVPMLVPAMEQKVSVTVLATAPSNTHVTGQLQDYEMILARALETDWMLECGRGLVMSFSTISTIYQFCHGSCDGSCKALPTGWIRNLTWFF